MSFVLSSFYTASALGTGNAETLANYRAHVSPGFREVAGEVNTRPVWFGSVISPLPEIGEGRLSTRTNRLLALAVREEPAFADLVRRHGAARVGVVLGSSNTGVHEAMAALSPRFDAPPDSPAVSLAPFDPSMLELGTPSLFLRDLLGAKGPAYTVSTACSSSAKAFGAAARLLKAGLCDAVVTGGVDGRCRFALNGFEALGALSAGRTRPLAPDRDGINLGEGVALFAMERGEGGLLFAGLGESSDAYHATAPDPEGRGAEAAMRAALAEANLSPGAIDYVNLHGTGTRANDEMEMKAVRRVFDPLPRYESTKALTGHCLGAAGAVEAAICALLLKAGLCHAALSNSFAFGGSNASVVLTA